MTTSLAAGGGLPERLSKRFFQLCSVAGRSGAIAFVPPAGLELLPEQRQRLNALLQSAHLREPVCAASLALFYHPEEVRAIPAVWQTRAEEAEEWNRYARAYLEVNRVLNGVCDQLVSEFGGLGEKATIEGWAGSVSSVNEYFPHCVSHRAFAEAAGLGWRGKHGLIVTPEAGPAVRLATLFVPGEVQAAPRVLSGCGDCRACLDLCPILPRAGALSQGQQGPHYRERCRRRIAHLGLEADVCGVCVRVCWEQVTSGKVGVKPAQSGT